MQPLIDRMILDLEKMLRGSGWRHVDTYVFEFYNDPKSNFGTVRPRFELIPDLLYYQEEGEDQCQIWFKVKPIGFVLSQLAQDTLFRIVKPFKDEDYTGRDKWISPHYPNGYWCNHALD